MIILKTNKQKKKLFLYFNYFDIIKYNTHASTEYRSTHYSTLIHLPGFYFTRVSVVCFSVNVANYYNYIMIILKI